MLTENFSYNYQDFDRERKAKIIAHLRKRHNIHAPERTLNEPILLSKDFDGDFNSLDILPIKRI